MAKELHVSAHAEFSDDKSFGKCNYLRKDIIGFFCFSGTSAIYHPSFSVFSPLASDDLKHVTLWAIKSISVSWYT